MGNKLGCDNAGARCATNCARGFGGQADRMNEFMENDGLFCDPAGTIFAETMEELGSHEKHLLFFCGSQNLAAVKWLYTMGANLKIVDSNGTSCLHHACRTGSVSIVQYLLESGCDVNLEDCSGWTPLHIACFMGGTRLDVVKILLAHRANIRITNREGKTPLDLCNDHTTSEILTTTLAFGHNDELVRPTPENSAASSNLDFQPNANVVPQGISAAISPTYNPSDDRRSASPSPGGHEDIHIEPFFVPQQAELDYLPAIQKSMLSKLGLDFFNASPGQGLAFLVSSGCVSDSPQPLLTHITSGCDGMRGDRIVFGQFIGESYSLSQILRLELMNALELEHTGIVEALHMVGRQMAWPADFEKLDRLSFCCALMWWRKHDSPDAKTPLPRGKVHRPCDGYDLRKRLKKKSELHQIMFAVLILHMNQHNLMGSNIPPLTLQQWVMFCRGITRMPDAFLIQLYHDISHYNQALVIMKPPKPDAPILQKMLRQSTEGAGWVKIEGSILPHVPESTWQRPPEADIWSEQSRGGMTTTRANALAHAAALSPFPCQPSARGKQFNPNNCMPSRGSYDISNSI